MDDVSLRSMVRDALRESEDEFGYAFGSPSSLYDIFVKPVADVGKIASAEVKKTVARGAATVQATGEAIVSALVPVLDADFDKINEKMRQRIASAEHGAGDAYSEVKRALGGKDAVMVALLYAPAAMLSMAAGSSAVKRLKRLFGLSEAAAARPLLSHASEEVRAAIQDVLRAAVKLAQNIASADDPAALALALGKRVRGAPRVAKFDNVKKRLLSNIAHRLSKDAKMMVAAGVPRRAQVIKDYERAVSTITDLGGDT